MNVVFDLDNTLVDELGSTVRPGIRPLLERLRSEGHTLMLWTNSRRARARDILHAHDLAKYFSRCLFREDYDPRDEGIRKDIRKIGGHLLVDDSPEEAAYSRAIGVRVFPVSSYRKGRRPKAGELDELYRTITRSGGILLRLFGRRR